MKMKLNFLNETKIGYSFRNTVCFSCLSEASLPAWINHASDDQGHKNIGVKALEVMGQESLSQEGDSYKETE